MEELALKDPKDLQKYLPIQASEALFSRSDRCLVTCVARLSPEKHVENFVKFIKANRTTLDDNEWIPFLAGSNADQEYASSIKQSLREVAPYAIIMNSFLSPQSLAAVFTRTALDFHPCEYDAAFGVPSIVQEDGHVGASVIVGNGAYIEVDMKEGYCWESVTAVLNDRERIQEVGGEARLRALAWDEAAYRKQLLLYIHKLCSDR